MRTTWLQRFVSRERDYRSLLPLYFLAAESWDLSGFDLVISTSHCVAKAAKRGPKGYPPLLLPHAGPLPARPVRRLPPGARRAREGRGAPRPRPAPRPRRGDGSARRRLRRELGERPRTDRADLRPPVPGRAGAGRHGLLHARTVAAPARRAPRRLRARPVQAARRRPRGLVPPRPAPHDRRVRPRGAPPARPRRPERPLRRLALRRGAPGALPVGRGRPDAGRGGLRHRPPRGAGLRDARRRPRQGGRARNRRRRGHRRPLPRDRARARSPVRSSSPSRRASTPTPSWRTPAASPSPRSGCGSSRPRARPSPNPGATTSPARFPARNLRIRRETP